MGEGILVVVSLPDFPSDLSSTVLSLVVGLLIGVPVAIIVGLILGWNVYLDKALSPIIYFLLAIPQSVFLPVFVLVFGFGTLTQKIVFAATHAFFVTAANTIAGVRELDPDLVVLGKSVGASQRHLFLKIVLPSITPIVLTGVRYAVVFAYIAVILSELFAAQQGMGLLLVRFTQSLRVDLMLAVVLIVSLISIVMNEVLRAYEKKLGKWRA